MAYEPKAGINIQALAGTLLKPKQTLVATKYFTTIINQPADKHRRQGLFLDALRTLSNFHIYYGQFLADQVTCRKCGHTYTTYHEKMTDVNISVELMTDALQDRCEVALLISADSDLVGPIKAMRGLFSAKRVIVAFPPNRTSFNLKQAANTTLHIGHNELAKSLFPRQVVTTSGVTIHCPKEWH